MFAKEREKQCCSTKQRNSHSRSSRRKKSRELANSQPPQLLLLIHKPGVTNSFRTQETPLAPPVPRTVKGLPLASLPMSTLNPSPRPSLTSCVETPPGPDTDMVPPPSTPNAAPSATARRQAAPAGRPARSLTPAATTSRTWLWNGSSPSTPNGYPPDFPKSVLAAAANPHPSLFPPQTSLLPSLRPSSVSSCRHRSRSVACPLSVLPSASSGRTVALLLLHPPALSPSRRRFVPFCLLSDSFWPLIGVA